MLIIYFLTPLDLQGSWRLQLADFLPVILFIVPNKAKNRENQVECITEPTQESENNHSPIGTPTSLAVLQMPVNAYNYPSTRKGAAFASWEIDSHICSTKCCPIKWLNKTSHFRGIKKVLFSTILREHLFEDEIILKLANLKAQPAALLSLILET